MPHEETQTQDSTAERERVIREEKERREHEMRKEQREQEKLAETEAPEQRMIREEKERRLAQAAAALAGPSRDQFAPPAEQQCGTKRKCHECEHCLNPLKKARCLNPVYV